MTIPKITPYSSGVANPDGSQTQTEFTQNMFDQLSYEAELATQLDATIDGMNNAVDEVEANAVSAENSANAAEAAAASAGYQGLWPDTGGSALKGEIWQTQVGGTPTGNYFTALQNTTVDPVGDNVNWKVQNDLNTGNLSDYTDIVFSTVNDMKSPSMFKVSSSAIESGDVSAKTKSYYDGWAAMVEPHGAANYTLTKRDRVRSALSDPSWEPDGYGDHYLFGGTDYVAKLNEKDVFIEMYGASESVTNNSPNIQACWDNNLVSHAKDGTFDFSDRLIIPGGYGWAFEGSGAGTELNWTSTSTTEWAISGLQSDDLTYLNLYRHVLKDFAIKGTLTVSLLLDLTRFKYSSMINVGIYDAAVCMQLRSAWSNKFEDCRFYPYEGHPSKTSAGIGVVLGSYNEDQTLLPDANEVNSVNFSSCVIEGAASAFLVNSYLNDVSVDNACNIDGCGCVVRAKSTAINFAIRSMTIRDSYLEWCLDSPLIIDIGAGQDCGVSVSFIDNYIQPTDVGVATLMNVISTGNSVFGKVDFRRNKEVHRSTNVPSSGYALYTPVGTSDLYINYFNEHDSSIIGVVPPQAYDPNTIDLRRLSTNIPFKPEVITFGDGEYGPIASSDPLTITPYMGTMRVRGTVKHSGTATAQDRPVAKIPTTARQTSYEVFSLVPLRDNSGVVSQGYVKLVNDELWIYGISDNGALIDFSYRTVTPQDFDNWPNIVPN